MSEHSIDSACAPLRENVSCGEISNYGCGGIVPKFFTPQNAESLVELILILRERREPFIVTGGGCNLLLADGRHEFSVVSTLGVKEFSVSGNKVSADCGVRLEDLIKETASRGLSGLENLNRIPGTLGGAVFMNAGAYGSEIAEVIDEVEFLTPDGEIECKPPSELGFSYRSSIFRQTGNIILRVHFSFGMEDPEMLVDKLEEVAEKRSKFDPILECSCGSVFKNPQGDYAGRLLEDCGYKGIREGSVHTLETHANIIYNAGRATANEIFLLTRRMKESVRDRHGVELQEEVRFIGFPGQE
jgi:UDP-N-acetylmuramate dehydrogenase